MVLEVGTEDVHRSAKVDIIQKELQRALFTVSIGSSVFISNIGGPVQSSTLRGLTASVILSRHLVTSRDY